jgi:hypothetical protein
MQFNMENSLRPDSGSTPGDYSLQRVEYPEIWRGISAIYEARQGVVAESTFEVQPGADPENIRLRYNTRIIGQSDGSLRFYPTGGKGFFTQAAPLAWQEIEGRRVPVAVEFRVEDARTVGFRVGRYDPRYALVIDPPYQWHTFYGSGSDDYGRAIALDGTGNVYVAGTSTASWLGDGNTAPKHAHSGAADIVVLKLDTQGAYQWHSFYGCGFADAGAAVAADSSGAIYLAGFSNDSWLGDEAAIPFHAAHSGTPEIVMIKLQGAVAITVKATGEGSGSLLSNPSGISYSYPTASSAQAWFNASDTVVLSGAAVPGFRADWGGTCNFAGGTEAGNGTALATCTLDNPGSAKIITVTFTRNLYLPLIRRQ